MNGVSELVKKIDTDESKVNLDGLVKLSTMIEQHIADSLDKERVPPVRFEIHKNICMTAAKLMQHCPVWQDSSIEKLQLSKYLTDEKHCDD